MIFKDSLGNVLFARGVQTSKSDRYFHICFDSHVTVGRRVHVYKTASARKIVLMMIEAGLQPVPGSKGWGASETGRGFLLTPGELSALSFKLRPEDVDEYAVTERILTEHGYQFEKASLAEEFDDIDYIAWKPGRKIRVQVKRREPGKAHSRLYLQTHETNPDRVYR